MLQTKSGRVTRCETLDDNTLLLDVDAGGETRRAIAYPLLTGDLREGDQVLLNTTARELSLGTGGYDFVAANLTRPGGSSQSGPGHIVKLRYTPLQHTVLAEEERESDDLAEFPDLEGMPIVAACLHSQMALAAAGARAHSPKAKIVYIMTDGAALPIGISNLVREIKEAGLIDETITCGQAFGGMREAVNVYSAMAVAKKRSGADIAIVCQGPGNVGAGTAVGFSGIEAGAVVNAARCMNGRAIVAVRMSQADPRERHRLISHHTLTVLSKVALADAVVPLPFMDDTTLQETHKELAALKLFEHHEIRSFDGTPGVDLLEAKGIRVTSMGRSFEEDPLFFLAASAAGRCAAEMTSPDFWG